MQKVFISLFIILGLLFVAQPAIAQRTNAPSNAPAPTSSSDACEKLRQQFQNSGGGDLIGKLPQYCNTSSIYSKIVNTLYWLIGIGAVIAIIYGGYLYMTAAGNAAQVKKARTVLVWAITGLVIAILAAVIVNLVVSALVENKLV